MLGLDECPPREYGVYLDSHIAQLGCLIKPTYEFFFFSRQPNGVIPR